MILTCSHCKIEFNTKKRRKYCSHNCYTTSVKSRNSNLEGRVCTSCNTYKLRDEFYPAPKLAAGFTSWCKLCYGQKLAPSTEEDKQKLRDKSKRYYSTHRDDLCNQMRQRNKDIRTQVLHAYGGPNPRCVCCGENTEEFLTLDHIHNDGAKHRQKDGNSLYRWAVRNNFPNTLQLLCWNCNHAKWKCGTCPHLTRKDPPLV